MKPGLTCLVGVVGLTACAGARGLAARPPATLASAALPVPAPEPTPQTPADPPRADGAKGLEGSLSGGNPRPTVAATLHFDVATLPVADWGRARDHDGFVMSMTKDTFQVRIDRPLFAEITIGLGASGSPFQVFTGGSFGAGPFPVCATDKVETVPAGWTGFSARKWTDDGIDVEMARATFDPRTCKGSPVASLRARAAALVPGFVYALRVRPSATAADPSAGDLVLFLPPGVFVAAGGDAAHPLRAAGSGSFTRLSFPLDGSGATSAAVRINPARLAFWGALRATGRPVWTLKDDVDEDRALLLGVDVVPQAAGATGSVVVSLPKGAKASAYAPLLGAIAAASS